MSKTKTEEVFIRQCRDAHHDTYDYSLVNYVNNSTKVKILCSIHGEFEQTPAKHLCQKTTCPECAKLSRNSKNASTSEAFICKAKKVHGNKYNYSLVDYKAAIKKVIIICSEHGKFTQRPNDHLNGYGCSRCGRKGGYDDTFFQNHPDYKNKKALLYLVEYNIKGENFLKIGITVRSMKERFGCGGKRVCKFIKTVPLNLYHAYQLEQSLLQKYKTYKMYPLKLSKKAGGHTECFTTEAYNLLLNELRCVDTSSIL